MAFTLTIGDESHTIEIVRRRPHLVIRVDGRLHQVEEAGEAGGGRNEIVVDGRPLAFFRAHLGDEAFVRVAGRTFAPRYVDPRAAAEAGGAGRDEIHAPMPGAVVSIEKDEGEPVARGETIITIESMKLQTALAAPRDGVVAEVLKRAGETFDKDAVIVRLAPLAEEA